MKLRDVACVAGLLGAAAVAASTAPAAAGQSQFSLTLYDQPDYRGASVTFYGDNANIGSTGFADRARSAQVRGTWRVCEGGGYRLRCEVLGDNVRDLAAYGFSGHVGSAQLLSGAPIAAYTPPYAAPPAVAAPGYPAQPYGYAPQGHSFAQPAYPQSAPTYAPPATATYPEGTYGEGYRRHYDHAYADGAYGPPAAVAPTPAYQAPAYEAPAYEAPAYEAPTGYPAPPRWRPIRARPTTTASKARPPSTSTTRA